MAALKLSLKTKKNVKNEEICEFYLQGKNVTPVEPTIIEYPASKSEEGSYKAQLVSELITDDWDDYDYDCDFPDVDEKFADYLLGGILPGRDKTDASESKYDVGSDYNTRDDVTTQEYEVELTESPSFTVFNMPSRVTVAGDGTYEAIRERRDAYERNAKKLLVRTDSVSQTVNTFAEREHSACQTAMPATRTVGAQAYGFDVAVAAAPRPRPPSPASGRPGATGEPRPDGRADEGFDRSVVYLERILAQNALDVDRAETSRESSPSPPRLALLFTLTLPGAADKGLAVRCMEWNRREALLLAVGYGRSRDCRDRADTADAVALWSAKNPYTPERFYEFDGLVVTCLKFSPQYPNRLAIGFQCGEIILIDVVSRKLNILFKISNYCSLEINGILDLFWSVRVENEFSVIRHHECLVACSMNGRVSRYEYAEALQVIEEKTLMRLSHVDDDGLATDGRRHNDETGRHDGHPAAVRKSPAAVFRAARLAELHHGEAYLVGTADGLVYSCLYDDPVACRAKIYAHLGAIRSMDRSPFSRDVFLTVGCDCTVKIWVGDFFQKPVMTLRAGGQVERAVWSRTEPTVIAAVVGDRIHVWDVHESTEEPASVHEAPGLNDGNKCAGAEFTPDGRRLCVSDVRGNVAVYAWSDATAAAGPGPERPAAADRLMYCVAKHMYGRQRRQSVVLQDHRPEYADVFARLRDEENAARLS